MDKPQVDSKAATAIAERCSDAYSVGRYRSWSAVAKMLARRGFDAREIEAILRSKWTRWAADWSHNPRYGQATAADLDRFLNTDHNLQQSVRALVAETFETAVSA